MFLGQVSLTRSVTRRSRQTQKGFRLQRDSENPKRLSKEETEDKVKINFVFAIQTLLESLVISCDGILLERATNTQRRQESVCNSTDF